MTERMDVLPEPDLPIRSTFFRAEEDIAPEY